MGHGTWYEPVDNAKEVEAAFNFVLSQDGVITYSLPCNVELWSSMLKTAERHQQLDGQEQKQTVKYARKHGFKQFFPE